MRPSATHTSPAPVRLRLGPRGLLWLLAPLLVLVIRRDQFVAQEIVDIKEILEGREAP
jgi:hypothetical protein